MKKFEVGKTYWTRSVGDHECIYRLTVIARTAKTITADVEDEGIRKFRVFDHFNEGIEHTRLGNYSLAPIWDAEHFE